MGLIAYFVCACIAYVYSVHAMVGYWHKDFGDVDGVDLCFLMIMSLIVAGLWPIVLIFRLIYLKIIKPVLDQKGIKIG